MFSITTRGNYNRTKKFLQKIEDQDYYKRIESYAERGRKALADATPKKTGKTANSWEYEIRRSNSGLRINYYNTNMNNGVNIAIILQYGHGTGWGGYVEGKDYINPAIKPIFDQLAEDIWREVTTS